jgi:hypothetical protein
MSIPLTQILDRLKSENLKGPTSELPKISLKDINPWRYVSNEYLDSDSRDPRWLELFNEYFIDTKHEVIDDLLFFVRQYIPGKSSSNSSIAEIDPVLVRRRIAGKAPEINDIIDWKQSFFLNLISQLPCTLTVSVCKKVHSTETTNKNGMIASKRVTKKVYAAPYKSRMDVKDALMNECSYPLVYYTINDFESEVLHLTLERDQYICVELSVAIPHDALSSSYTNATELTAAIKIEESTDPFPIPDGYTKCTLFQGAVSFAALSTVYQQRGVANANQMKNGWGKFVNQEQQKTVRTEYILMRGPHGKGQCQVAIQDPSIIPPEQPSASIFNIVKGIVKSQFSSDEELPLKAPELLDCSLTYVNVPWQSISSDLLNLKIEP